MGRTYDDVSSELKVWAEANFGKQPFLAPGMGLIEEYGEFLSAKTRQQQEDGAADFTIYLIDLCNKTELPLNEILKQADALYAEIKGKRDRKISLARNYGSFCASVSRASLKMWQGIRVNEGHAGVVIYQTAKVLALLYKKLDMDGEQFFADVVDRVWVNEVKNRNWPKNPVDGK
jgi:NTP pyrophosphatase (non-canonical NTP hydrolase)